jgi:hypothetical protein
MGTYGWADGDFQVDATDGGTLQSMKAHTREIDGFEIQRGNEDNTTLGSAWEASVLTGLRAGQEFTVKGLYDDTATTGPNATYNGTHAATRTCVWTFASGKTATFEAWFLSFKRVPKPKGKLDYEVRVKPTGAVTEA